MVGFGLLGRCYPKHSEEIVSFHMTNIQPERSKFPRHRKIAMDSKIVRSKHATILANWIQRKDANAKIPKDNKYFKLIYRGSRDGYDISTIRRKCDRKGACILIIRIKESETIIGGYNPFGWNSDINDYHHGNGYWIHTSESFIFSLGDGKDFENFKISRVANANFAMYESNYLHPQLPMGSISHDNPLNFGNSDLVINNNRRGTCNQRYYRSSILGINNFTIEEMEIFTYTNPSEQRRIFWSVLMLLLFFTFLLFYFLFM